MWMSAIRTHQCVQKCGHFVHNCCESVGLLQIMKHDSPEHYMPSTCIRPRKIMYVSGFPTDNIQTWLTPMFLLV